MFPCIKIHTLVPERCIWICTSSSWDLFLAVTRLPSKFHGNLFSSFCLILLTNQWINTKRHGWKHDEVNQPGWNIKPALRGNKLQTSRDIILSHLFKVVTANMLALAFVFSHIPSPFSSDLVSASSRAFRCYVLTVVTSRSLALSRCFVQGRWIY